MPDGFNSSYYRLRNIVFLFLCHKNILNCAKNDHLLPFYTNDHMTQSVFLVLNCWLRD